MIFFFALLPSATAAGCRDNTDRAKTLPGVQCLSLLECNKEYLHKWDWKNNTPETTANEYLSFVCVFFLCELEVER